jgi:hypothetical protein
MPIAQTQSYPGITWQDSVYFADGHQDLFSLGLPPTAGQLSGTLAQYTNNDPGSHICIDRLKIAIDPNDSSENYLFFDLLRADMSLVYSLPIPMSELIVGNPNFTNIEFFIKNGYTGQINFEATISSGTLLEYVQYRVRKLDWKHTKI